MRIVGFAALKMAFVLLSTGAAVEAADIKCLCAEAIRPVMTEVGPGFEQTTGHKLAITYDLAPVVKRKIDAGEAFDVAILNPSQVEDLLKEGKLGTGTRTNIARAGVGLAVRAGAPKPNISSVEAFKRTLLEAKSVTFPDEGTSGAYFRGVLDRLGIAELMQPKLKPAARGAGFGMVARGEAEMMVTIIPQLLANPGIEVVGPLPAELQTWIALAGAVGASAKEPAGAKALLEFLTAPAGVSMFKAKGWEPFS